MSVLTYYAFVDEALKKYAVYETLSFTPLKLEDTSILTPLDGPTTLELATRLAEAAGVQPEASEEHIEESLFGILCKYPIVAVVETRGETTHMVTYDLFNNAISFGTPHKDVLELAANIVTHISAIRGYPIIANGMSLHEVQRRLKELAAKTPGVVKRTWTRVCDVFRPKQA